MPQVKHHAPKITAMLLILSIAIGVCNISGVSNAATKRYRAKPVATKKPIHYVAPAKPALINSNQPENTLPNNSAPNNTSSWQAVPYQQMADQPKNLLFILDVSKSMEAKLHGSSENKLEMAKRVINETLRTVPSNVKVGLRVYGHKYSTNAYGAFGLMSQQDDPNCKASALLVPMGFNNHSEIMNRMTPLQPTGNTPISYSVEQAAQTDFFGTQGKKIVVLVSDGRETCSRFDPCDTAVNLVRKGIDIKFNVIGFDLNDSVAEDQLRCLALSTKGKFISADNEEQLVKGMRSSTEYVTDVKARVVPTP